MFQNAYLVLRIYWNIFLGIICVRLKSLNSAAQFYEGALKLMPLIQSFSSSASEVIILISLSHIYVKLGNFQRAEANFQQLLHSGSVFLSKTDANPALRRRLLYGVAPIAIKLFLSGRGGVSGSYISHILRWTKDDPNESLTAREFLRSMADQLEQDGANDLAKEIRNKVREVLNNSPSSLR